MPYNLPINFYFDGVLLFFVLSGFLIGGILVRQVDKHTLNFYDLKRFWIRRWLRTLPAYFVVLIVILLLSDAGPQDVYKYFFFLQSVYSIHPGFFPEAWSLAVEEWFYLLVPIFIALLGLSQKIEKRFLILYVAFSICFLSIAVRWFEFQNLELKNSYDWAKFLRTRVFTRLDSLMYGVIGAWIHFYYGDLWKRTKMPLFLAGVVITVLHKLSIDYIYTDQAGHAPGLYHSVFSFSIGSLGVLLLLPLLSEIKSGSGYVFKIVTFISLISYSWYLCHHTIIRGYFIPPLYKYTESFPGYIRILSRYAFYYVSSLGLSYILYQYVEKPGMWFRDRYFR